MDEQVTRYLGAAVGFLLDGTDTAVRPGVRA